MPQRIAFLIGNQMFRPDSGLLLLQGPGNDVAALARLLRNPERGNFEVHEFLDKRSYEIMPELAQSLDSAVSGDLFLIYYSGHGKLNRNGGLCLATADTRQGAALVTTSILARHLREVVDESDCSQVVLILDCCYSGAADLRGDVGSELRHVEDAQGFYIVTATTRMQVAREAAPTPGGVVMGKFTAALVNGIESGAADQGGKGKILLSDLRRYLGQADIGSTPQFFDRRASGDPLISLNPDAVFPLFARAVSPNVTYVRRQAQDIAALAAQYAPERTDPKHYFNEAATLRLNLAVWQNDEEFARNDGKIVYFVDLNIVSLFLQPKQEASYVIPFGDPAAASYDTPTAIITSEFLFSGYLTGQHNEALLIAPAHAEEVSDFMTWLGIGIEGEADEKGLNTGLNDKVQTLVRKVATGEINNVRAMIELSELIPTAAAANILSAPSWEGAHHLVRLANEKLLCPLANYRAATEFIMSPEPARVADWVARISRERRPSNPIDRIGVMRDAEALTQVILLNESADERTRYVLVTADRSLHDAYTAWYWDKRPDAFIVRSPLQYTPILNTHEMFRQTTDPIANSLDILFRELGTTLDSGYPMSLSLHSLCTRNRSDGASVLKHYGFSPSELKEFDIRLFRNLRQEWHEASRACVMLNVAVISRRAGALLDPLVELLRGDWNLIRYLFDNQKKNLQQIEAMHLRLTTRRVQDGAP